MSKCGRTHLLEAMTAGEVPGPLETELRAHASGCARCHHELSWLESEQRLFRQRAGRDEVQQLWRGVEQRAPVLRSSTLNRLLVAMAAALLVVLGVGRVGLHSPAEGSAMSENPSSDELLQSFNELMFMSSEDPQSSCWLRPGVGFTCSATTQSTALASR